jgi:hypothetical protein
MLKQAHVPVDSILPLIVMVGKLLDEMRTKSTEYETQLQSPYEAYYRPVVMPVTYGKKRNI